ncbi:MAG TPA: hypothetical protein VIK77_04775 [Tissierellaceae bacterium]
MKKISLLLVVTFALSLFCSTEPSLVKASQKDITANVIFITDDSNEKLNFSKIPTLLEDKEFIDDHNIGNNGLKKLGDEIIIKGVYNNHKNSANINEVDSVFINYELLHKEDIISYAKEQIESGKGVYFYGNDIDKELFLKTFGIEDCLIEDKADEKGKLSPPPTVEPGEIIVSEKSILMAIGVVKEDWGYNLVTIESSYFDYYLMIDSLLHEAIHAKKLKIEKPYEQIGGKGITASSSYIDNFPIVTSRRSTKNFNNNWWRVITDFYLHRVPDEDAYNDYFIIETMTEFDYNSGNHAYAMRMRDELQPTYSVDTVRDGAPKSQSGSITITVSLYPPAVSFTYSPGPQKVSVKSALSLSNNNFYAEYTEEDFWTTCFLGGNIFRTCLSFKSTGTSLASVKLYQRFQNDYNLNWYYSHNPYTLEYRY